MCRVSVTVRLFAMCAQNDLGTLSIGRSKPMLYLPDQHAQREERMSMHRNDGAATNSRRELALGDLKSLVKPHYTPGATLFNRDH